MANLKPRKKAPGLSEDEKAAARERVRELNADNPEEAARQAIAKMEGTDREYAERLDAIVKKTAPELQAKTWYGMPAYAKASGETICFYQNSKKFKTRYSTLGFSDKAKLDDGDMWPSSFALMKMTPAVEKKIAELIKRAIGV